MLSRLRVAFPTARTLGSALQTQGSRKLLQNVITKRWSGHNNMEIRPETTDWAILKNWLHFYTLLGLIPVTIFTTIVTIRENSELSEVPDGYEPRHWEYYRHPITRWMAKHMYDSPHKYHETMLSLYEYESEKKIMEKIIEKARTVMGFYHDHRSMYFRPRYADYFRKGRDDALYIKGEIGTDTSYRYDSVYDPDIAFVPTEGYPDGPVE